MNPLLGQFASSALFKQKMHAANPGLTQNQEQPMSKQRLLWIFEVHCLGCLQLCLRHFHWKQLLRYSPASPPDFDQSLDTAKGLYCTGQRILHDPLPGHFRSGTHCLERSSIQPSKREPPKLLDASKLSFLMQVVSGRSTGAQTCAPLPQRSSCRPPAQCGR